MNLIFCWLALLAGGLFAETPEKLRIIAFGAHPDDNEIRAGGCAALWARQGHKVKFVSMANGDLGHHHQHGPPLARRRAAEVRAAAQVLGIETLVLDIPDGTVMPTLENRATVVRLIREWKAEVVLCHRPNDYHPDHRYTGVLVQDAAFIVTVPFYLPEVPALETNPVFLYYYDRFTDPRPFRPDIAVAIDGVLDLKLRALDKIESQFLEWLQRANPIDTSNPAQRRAALEKAFLPRFAQAAVDYPDLLREYYGPRAAAIRYAEAFQVCEYGRGVTRAELRRFFPVEPIQ